MRRNLTIVLMLLGVAAIIMWLATSPVHGTTTTLTGTILDAQGNGVNGSVTFQLPVPAQDTASNTAIANSVVRYKLVNGVIQSGPPLYDVAGLQPANLFYVAKVFDSAGNLVMSGNYVVTGASFNFGAATPTAITTSNISYTNAISSTANNTLTGNNTFTGLTTLALPINLTQGGFTSVFTGTTTAARTWTLQDTSDTFVYRASTDSLTNKTIDCTLNTLAKNPCVVYSTASASTNIAIPTATMATAGVSGNTYRFSADIDLTAVGVGCTGNTNVTLNIIYTDPNSTAQQTESWPVLTIATAGNGVVGAVTSSNLSQQKLTSTFRAKASTTFQYSTTYTLGTGCTTGPSYQVYPILEQLQ